MASPQRGRRPECLLWTDEQPKKDLSFNFMGKKEKQQITDRELTSQFRVNRLNSDASAYRQMARLICFYASTSARLMQSVFNFCNTTPLLALL